MSQEEREEMELDVLFVGAGVANLCAAYRLKKNIDAWNEKAEADGKEPIEEPMMLVIDKADRVGGHTLSGAVVDPKAMRELFPDVSDDDLPFTTPVTGERVMKLTASGQLQIPGFMLPKEMHSDGCFLASAAEMVRWLAEKCEEEGIEVYTEFACDDLIRDDDGKVVGARIADKGLEHDGTPGDAFTPGMDLLAKITVLGEGTRGYVSQKLIKDAKLDADANEQIWSLGIKEIIEIPEGRVKAGEIIHTMGYPLDTKTYGGSFIYAMSDTSVAIGLVLALDYPDPTLATHEAFLRLKKHPMVAEIIEGGEVKEYGAKTLPEGGYYAMPQFAVDGAVMVGDSAGFLNAMRLKGLHLAMRSGTLAADKMVEAMAGGDFSASALDYRAAFEADWSGQEMQHTKNFRQGFHGGLIPGMISTGFHMISGGALPGGRKTTPADYGSLKPANGRQAPEKIKTDAGLYLDIETDVFKSGAIHREEQVPHCRILDVETCKECKEKYDAPCTRFCPAKVYEEKTDADGNFDGIHISFSNCLHCKTCEIKDPMQNIEWLPPEGGDGPKYKMM